VASIAQAFLGDCSGPSDPSTTPAKLHASDAESGIGL
jgi:hypothetical protein